MNSASRALPGNRFERRRERTRQDLLAAATGVLAEKGLHRTKVADIATAADVGVGTFYLHFPDKEALLTDREKLSPEQQTAAGIQFCQDEQFFIRPKPETAEATVKEAA